MVAVDTTRTSRYADAFGVLIGSIRRSRQIAAAGDTLAHGWADVLLRDVRDDLGPEGYVDSDIAECSQSETRIGPGRIIVRGPDNDRADKTDKTDKTDKRATYQR